MNKEEMINALNSLAARIKAGQLDIDDVALRNAEIEKVDARIENYKRELKEIEEIEKSGYTKGSEHDLAVEKMKEIQNRINNVNERIYANHQVQEKLREHITANNKIIAKTQGCRLNNFQLLKRMRILLTRRKIAFHMLIYYVCIFFTACRY